MYSSALFMMLVIAMLPAAARASPPPSVASWDLTGFDGGSTIVDSTASSGSGTPPGPVATLHGGAVRTATGVTFDGLDGYVELALGAVAMGGAMSVEGVIKFNLLNLYTRLLDCGNGEESDNIVVSNYMSTGKLQFGVVAGPQGSTSRYVLSPDASDLLLGVRYHIVVTVSGTTMTSYINGVAKGTGSSGAEPRVLTRSKCYIGKSNWANNDYLSGEVSMLKIFSGAMTQADVTAAYQSTFPIIEYAWDFTGVEFSTKFVDSVRGIEAEMKSSNGGALPKRSALGVVLVEGSQGFVDLLFNGVKFGGAMTIEMIAKWNTFTDWSRLFGCGSGEDQNNIILATEGTTGVLSFKIRRVGNADKHAVSTSPLVVGKFYHIIITIVSTQMDVYVDGVLKATQPAAWEPLVAERSKCYIGKSNYASPNTYFDGVVNSLKIYSGAMSAAKVAAALLKIEFPRIEYSWDFTGTTVPCINARYLNIDGSAASGRLNLHEVVLKGADGVVLAIGSGTMSSTEGDTSPTSNCGATCAVTQCFNGVTSGDDQCQTTGPDTSWLANFDLGAPKCVATVELYNRIPVGSCVAAKCEDRIIGAVLSLGQFSQGISPLWSVPVTSGTQNEVGGIAAYTLTFSVGPADSVSGIASVLVGGTTRSATGVVLDGVSGYAALGLGATVVTGGSMTIVSVLKWNAFQMNTRIFECMSASGDDRFFVKNAGTAGTLWWEATNVGVGKEVHSATDSDLVLNARYHIVATVSGTFMRIYINGMQKGENNAGWEPTPKIRTACAIGGVYSPYSLLSAEVSSLKIYSGAMTQAQVTADYESAFPILEFAWDFTGTVASCVTAQYLYIDGSAAVGDLNLYEVVFKGADGAAFAIASGAMSFQHDSLAVENCFDGKIVQATNGQDGLCHSSGIPWWAYFDLGVPKCVATIELYNRGFSVVSDRIIGAVLSLRTTSSGAPLWSVPVTSGMQNGGYTLTFKVGPTDSISGISTTLVAGATRTATGMVFDGVDGFVNLNLDAETMGGPMTVEGVIAWKAFTTASRLFGCGNGQGSDNIAIFSSGNGLTWAIYNDAGESKHATYSAISTLDVGVQYHIVVTVSGTTMTSYINGVKEKEVTNGWEPSLKTRTKCYIGKSNWGTDGALSGEVSYLKIYSGAMSQAQVAAACAAAFPTLQYYWDFTGTTGGVTATDSIHQKVATFQAGTGGAMPTRSVTGVAIGNVVGTGGFIGVNFDAEKLGGPMTIVVVMKWNAFHDSARLFDCGNNGLGTYKENNIVMKTQNAYGQLSSRFKTSQPSRVASPTTSDLVVGVRYHIVATVSGTTITQYINGVKMGEKDDAAMKESPMMTRQKCFIGKSNWDDPYASGEVSSLKIYTTAMAQYQVVAAYAAAFPILEYYWDFINTPSTACSTQVYQQTCHSISPQATDSWCNANCNHNPVNCPPVMCSCLLGTTACIVDSQSGAEARLVNGTQRTAAGVLFDGTNGNFVDLQVTLIGGPVTLEIVAKWNEFGPSFSDARLFDCGGGHGTENQVDNFAIKNTQNGEESNWGMNHSKLAFFIAQTSLYKSATAPKGIFDILLGVRYHIVATAEGTAMRIYINGALVVENLSGHTPNAVVRSRCYLGRSNVRDRNYDFLSGEISSVRIYSGAMNAQKVGAAYQSYKAPPSAMPSSAPTTAAPTTVAPSGAPTTAAPTQILGSLISVTTPVPVVREDGNTDEVYILSLDLAAVPQVGLAVGEVATVSCASNPEELVLEPSSFQVTPDASSSAKIAVRGARDRDQLASRTGVATCEVSAPGRVSQSFAIEVTVLGVAQPSFSLLCSIARGSDPLRTITELGTCGTTATTNGNSSLLIIGGDPSGVSPQPPFDTSTTTRVLIGGVSAAAVVVNGSSGTRLLVATPTIEELQASRGKAVEDFVFGYYGFSIVTTGGGVASAGTTYHGTFDGSIAVGASANITDAATGRQQCALLGFCPDAMPSGAGLYYSDKCEGCPNPVVDTRWQDEAFADLYAYGRPPRCRSCPEGCACPGGRRCRPFPGFYVAAGEDLQTMNKPLRCAPPAKLRCTGYDVAVGGAKCGVGFDQGSMGCSKCAQGYFTNLGACDVCPAIDMWGALIFPTLANLALALTAFACVFGLKLVWSLISARCDPGDERRASGVAFDALKQTAFFTVSIVSALQLLAVVVVGAEGEAPPTLKLLAMALSTFVLEPPLVNPQCVEGDVGDLGLSVGGSAQLAVLIGALIVGTLDKLLQFVPCLRAETLCFGYKCCSRCDAGRALRRLWWSFGTPFIRYFLSTGLTVAYVRVVRVAIIVVDCSPSMGPGSSFALDSDPTVPCWDAAHMPLFLLAVVTLALVGVLWPLVTACYLTQRFARKPIERCATPKCLRDRCDQVHRGMPNGWLQIYDSDEKGMIFSHPESGAMLRERPINPDQWGLAVVAAEVAREGVTNQEGDTEGDLPTGWKRYFSRESGLHYYHRASDGHTSWDRPSVPLLEGWAETNSAVHGRTYYFNEATGATAWERPTAASINVWWWEFRLSVGAHVAHKTRGAGTIVLLETNGLQRVHVKFAGGGVHRYKKTSWWKLTADVVGGDAAASTLALPEGWVQHYSENHGRPFYFHEATGATEWMRPSSTAAAASAVAAVPASPAGSLPLGWTEIHSALHGQSYYHHAESGETAWQHPNPTHAPSRDTPAELLWTRPSLDTVAANGTRDAAAASAATSLRGAAVAASGAELPQGWTEIHSALHGQSYYHHAESGETAWQHPAPPNGIAEASGEGGDGNIGVEMQEHNPADVVGDNDDASMFIHAEASPQMKFVRPLNEIGCIPACCWGRLNLARPMVVQQRVKVLGGRARAYDVYVDNAFEPRFFWIPVLRIYTLLLLTVFDLGLSGRRENTIAHAVGRFAAVLTVLTLFTVAVLAPCPFHRIDRWNIAKRLVLLVLNSAAAAMTLSLSLAELGVGGMRKTVDDFAIALGVLLPLCFTIVLLAFLLSRGLGCCARCAVSAEEREKKRKEALAQRDAEEAAAERTLAFAVQAEEEAAGEVAGSAKPRRNTLIERIAGIGTIVPRAVPAAVELQIEMTSNPGRKRQSTFTAKPPPAPTPPPQPQLFVLPSPASPPSPSSSSASSSSSSDDEEEVPKFVARWRKRKSAALTLSAAIYGTTAAEKEETTEALNAHIATMFRGAASLSVPGTLKLVRTRASGTDLGGNMHAQLKLVEAASGDAYAVTPVAFAKALHGAIQADENGSVAEWLLDELADAHKSMEASRREHRRRPLARTHSEAFC